MRRNPRRRKRSDKRLKKKRLSFMLESLNTKQKGELKMSVSQHPKTHNTRRLQGASSHQTVLASSPCPLCKDTGYHVNIDLMGKLNAEPCPSCSDKGRESLLVMGARCKNLNGMELDPDKVEEMDLTLILPRRGVSGMLLQSISLFLKEWPLKKKEQKKAEILANPGDYSIVRPVETHQTTALHLLTRNAVFRILGSHERAARTVIDDFGQVIDLYEERTFLGWGGAVHIKISGPVVDISDQGVFYACIKIWHERNNSKGTDLITSFSEIWRTLGNKSKMNNIARESLKRSLKRLAEVRITAQSMENQSFWVGGIINEVIYHDHENPKFCCIAISFNKSIVPLYLSGSYSTLSLSLLNGMKSAYTKRVYEFLMSHNDKVRSMRLEKWQEVLGVSIGIPKKTFKQRMREALTEMKNYKILSNDSHIDRTGIVHTEVTNAASAAF